jgi:hypothetical protein
VAQALAGPDQTPPPQLAPGQFVLRSGDQPFQASGPHEFPTEKKLWDWMQERFSTGWTETFHFLHRLTAKTWLDMVHRNWLAGAPLESGIGRGRTLSTDKR